MPRPPKKPEDRRTDSMKLPMTEREKSLVQDAADAVGEKPVTWARETLIRAAKRIARRQS